MPSSGAKVPGCRSSSFGSSHDEESEGDGNPIPIWNSAEHAEEASDDEMLRLGIETEAAAKAATTIAVNAFAMKAADSSSDSGLSSDEETPPVPEPATPLRQGRRRSGNVYSSPDDAVSMMLKGLQDRFDALESAGVPEEAEETAEMTSTSVDLSYIRLSTPLQFNSFLKYHGIDLAAFDSGMTVGTARSLRDLWLEVIWQTTNLQKYPDPDSPNGFRVQRLVKLCVVELMAEIKGETRLLVMQSEGNRKDLNQRLASKMFMDESETECFGRCMLQNFFIAERISRSQLEIIKITQHEELRGSAAYPGMNTIYDIYTLTVKVRDAQSPDLATLGLPDGGDFYTEKTGWNRVGLPSRKRIWSWVTPEVYRHQKARWEGLKGPESDLSPKGDDKPNGYPMPQKS